MEHGWTGFLTIAVLCASLADAHSWVEQLRVVSPNGTFTGAKGYPRGNVPRSPSFNDKMMQWQLPTNQGSQLLSNMAMCRPSQQKSNYTADSPKLQAAPGDVIALRYQENGHVTQPWIKSGKPEHSGTVYVYGTDQPHEDDTLMAIHPVWNLDGTGGDRRGKLLSTQYFDDGQCYQVDNDSYISVDRQNQFVRKPEAGSVEGANLWCQTDIVIPKTVASKSTYTLYWVWDWPTLATANTTYLPELYTTCIDIDVIDSPSTADKNQANVAFAQVTNYGDAAIQSIFENVKTLGTQTVSHPPYTDASSPAVTTAGSPVVSATSSPETNSPQAESKCGTPTTVTMGATTITKTISVPSMAATTIVQATTITVTKTMSVPPSSSSHPAIMKRRSFAA